MPPSRACGLCSPRRPSMSSRVIPPSRRSDAWWGASEVIEIYIGQFSGGWALDGQTQGWSVHADPLPGLERWIGEVEARHASRWRKARVDLWLSGGIARPFVCGPVAGLSGWREAEAFAAAGAAEATGLAGACRVRLEDWPGDGATVATAL